MGPKLSKFEGALMIGFAVFIDVVQALGEALLTAIFTLLTIGSGVALGAVLAAIWGFFWSTIATVVINFWFNMKGIDQKGSKKFAHMISVAIAEQVPYLNGLPLWTVSTWRTISQHRAKEKQQEQIPPQVSEEPALPPPEPLPN